MSASVQRAARTVDNQSRKPGASVLPSSMRARASAARLTLDSLPPPARHKSSSPGRASKPHELMTYEASFQRPATRR